VTPAITFTPSHPSCTFEAGADVPILGVLLHSHPLPPAPALPVELRGDIRGRTWHTVLLQHRRATPLVSCQAN